MEDTVQLHVSYECEVRDVIAHRVFRPGATMLNDHAQSARSSIVCDMRHAGLI